MKQESVSEENNSPPLILQQRRLNHVTSLCIRNITISLTLEDDSDIVANNDPLLYFTLHSYCRNSQNTTEEIFMSEKVAYSMNPTWPNFTLNGSQFSHISRFIVRLWVGHGSSYMPAMQWEVSLKLLHCIGKSLGNDKVTFHSNAVVFGLHGLYYAQKQFVTTSETSFLQPSIDCTDIRTSYKVIGLRRILSLKGATVQCKKSLISLQSVIKAKMKEQSVTVQLESELENIQEKVNHYQSLLKREQSLLLHERNKANSMKDSLHQQEEALKLDQRKLDEERSKHLENINLLKSTQEKVSLVATQLSVRQRDILSQLSHIFPISKVQNVTTSKSQKKNPTSDEIYAICGVKLPGSENFNHKDDLSTSVALGYVTQLMLMISKFTLVPLRYPLFHKGSQSNIYDGLTDKLSDRDRIFPVFVKGSKDRFLFDYGVYLLNKNVAQLRYHFALGTFDLRPTLENIKSLLDDRLGTRTLIGFHSQPIAINDSRHVRLRSAGSTSSMSSKHTDIDITQPLNYASASDDLFKVHRPSMSDASSGTFSQRMGTRHTEFLSLRDELLGGTGNAKPQNKLTASRKFIRDPVRQDHPPASLSRQTSFHAESVESVLPHSNPHRTQLTGLEELNQSNQEKKETKSLALARAELLGKRSNQRPRDGARWTRRSAASSSPGLQKKRDQLFGKHSTTKDYSDSNVSSGSDSSRSNVDNFSSETNDAKPHVTSSSKSTSQNDEDFVIIDQLPNMVNGNHQPLRVEKLNSSDPMPYMSAINDQNVDEAAGSRSNRPHSDDFNESNQAAEQEEIDLC